MIYQAYRTQANFLDQVRPLAAAAGSALRLPWTRLGQEWPLHTLAGVLETFANLTVSHARLPFGIESFPAGNHAAIYEGAPRADGSWPYGVFSGRRWNNEVYPMVRDIIQMTD